MAATTITRRITCFLRQTVGRCDENC